MSEPSWLASGEQSETTPFETQKKGKTGPDNKPLSGAALGGIVSTVLSLAADFAKPLGNYAVDLLALSVLILGCALLIRFKFSKHHIITTTWQFSAVCTVVFFIVVVGQMMVPSSDRNRGVAASTIPVVASLQVHILPLSPTQRELFDLEDALKSDDLGKRLAAATAAMSANDNVKQASLDLIFASSDKTLKAVAMEEAIKDKLGMDIEFDVPETATNNPVAEAVRATRFHISSVSPDGRSFSGSLIFATGGQMAAGTVSSHGISITGNTMIADKLGALNIDVHPDPNGELVGHAYSGQISTPVTLPLI